MKKLGFGLMRLPRCEDGKFDVERTAKMADEFLKNGFTYFDTAYVYEGSEETFREAIAKRHPRDSYTIANKLPAWKVEEKGDVERIFNESLSRCGIEYFDYYLLHSLVGKGAYKHDEFGSWDFCQEMKRQGKIRNFGFSFHGDEVLLDELLTDHPEVDFVQLQINYLDWNSTVVRAQKNYEVCRKFGKPVIIMEPVKGGQLASFEPETEKILKNLNPDASCASYALRFAGTLDGVMTVLSGMSDEEQMADNIRTFSDLKPLSAEEAKAVCEVRDRVLASKTVGCTACRYCVKDCPAGIDIPGIFRCYNELTVKGEHPEPHGIYRDLTESGKSSKANECKKCGKCEAVCPQHIEIIKSLEESSRMLDR